ncbi:MAG TPA: VOC family protein [Gemmatimonadaceae bacterium]|nr:VOC family protein [Gemmatimonadaceae bacterium]
MGPRKITPCLWFDTQAEEAAKLYVSIFPDSRIVRVERYPDAGTEVHGKPPGSVMVVVFSIGGQEFTALNGGPQFNFDEAVSFQVPCSNQEEIDHFWSRLTADGGEEGPCGWLKDRFGLSWQVFPTRLHEMLSDQDPGKRNRVMEQMLKMKKLDIAPLERAFGQAPPR